MGFKDKITKATGGTKIGFTVWFFRFFIRFLQFIMAVAVIGLYAQDVAAATRLHVHQDSRWLYAVVVSTFSALSSLIFLLPFPSSPFFAWDLTLFVLWVALFGVFGKLFINNDLAAADSGVRRMQNAVWVDLVNMLLWLLTGIYGFGVVMWGRRERTVHTGRAFV